MAGGSNLEKTMSNIKTQNSPKVLSQYKEENEYTLYAGDCMRLAKKLPDNLIDLTITSPPYCIGKSYESTKDVDDFFKTHLEIFPEIVRLTKPGGSICWQVGYHVKNRRITPLDYLLFDIARSIPEIQLRNRIIWTYGHGLHENERFTGRHETILWFTKGDEYQFDLDAVRVPQKYPGKKHYKGPQKGIYSGNPLGKNPSDVWEIPNVNANHKEKTDHPCQFPIGLAQRLIKALSLKNGLVFDPFAGSGTTGAAAAIEGRRFIGAEIDKNYCKIAKQRISHALKGDLPFREVDQPVLEPSLAGSVSKRPDHFKWIN